MILRWLISKTLRDACALRNHVHGCSMRSAIAPPAANQLVQGALLDLQAQSQIV